jgi:hypothetical protein
VELILGVRIQEGRASRFAVCGSGPAGLAIYARGKAHASANLNQFSQKAWLIVDFASRSVTGAGALVHPDTIILTYLVRFD